MSELVATITYKDTMKYLRCSRKSLLDLLRNGTIFGFKNAKGRWCISVASIRAYQEGLRQNTDTLQDCGLFISESQPISIQPNDRDPYFLQNILETLSNIDTTTLSTNEGVQKIVVNIAVVFGELLQEVTVTRMELLNAINQIKQIKFEMPPPQPSPAIVEASNGEMIEDISQKFTDGDKKKAAKIIQTAVSVKRVESVPKLMQLQKELRKHPLWKGKKIKDAKTNIL